MDPRHGPLKSACSMYFHVFPCSMSFHMWPFNLVMPKIAGSADERRLSSPSPHRRQPNLLHISSAPSPSSPREERHAARRTTAETPNRPPVSMRPRGNSGGLGPGEAPAPAVEDQKGRDERTAAAISHDDCGGGWNWAMNKPWHLGSLIIRPDSLPVGVQNLLKYFDLLCMFSFFFKCSMYAERPGGNTRLT